ncbi:MAG: ABC transporter permease [Chitinophagaceae bacterium]|nr:ABC transporter permease [Chitinophagaceae bacterium]MCW5926710.1 ABC transporter permease [Chitinophagaceae bacterium]
MFKNYFKTAWRNLIRNKTFSIIKILGLSMGLAVCMLIFLYTKDEVSYDQFHENKARLFRVTQEWHIGSDIHAEGITNGSVGESFAKQIPEVQQYVRIMSVAVTVKENNEVFTENPLFVDENFLSLFTFPLVQGNIKTALKDPNAVVLSKDMAKKYFGTTDVVGETMQVKIDTAFENFIVTAVVENPPQNSTLKPGILMPYKFYEKYNDNTGWIGGSLNTFLLLSPQADVKAVQEKMQVLFNKNTEDELAKRQKEAGYSIKIILGLQPLTGIHLSKKAAPDNGLVEGSSPAYSYILTCIAVFILIIACINFINLAVAQSLKRSKEIGIRKVVGGTRVQLIKQFLAESFLVSVVAFAVAVLLTYLLLPFFNELANKKLSLSYLTDVYLYAGYFLLLLVTSFIAGFYPSLVLSAFHPVKVLYSRQKLMGRNYITKGLIVLQFALAILLIIGTITINSQLNFLMHADLGYDTRNLVRLDIPINRSSDDLPALFKNELMGKPGIVSVAARNGGRSTSAAKVEGKQIIIDNNRIDEQFLATFKIPIIAGRNFSPDFPFDLMKTVIVNESFVKEAGWKPKDAIGKTVSLGPSHNSRMVTVTGVIRDYHFLSLKEKIMPQVFSMNPNFNFGQIWIRIEPGDVPETLSLLRNTCRKLMPYFPYSYQFMDDINAMKYETETRWKQIISIASALFIFISCIGLLGLVMLSVEQRTKEIGIRKVLGAAVSGIILLVSKEFIMLIAIAFVIAIPIGHYFINKWLQDFAYRIDIEWWMFAFAGLLVILIALLTISFQAIKAAMANPVKALRTE